MVKVKLNNPVSDLELSQKSKNDCVIVCVTSQQKCTALIEAGARIARQEKLELLVLSIMPKTIQSNADAKALDTLFQCAIANDAIMSVYYTNEIWSTAQSFLQRQSLRHLVAGTPAPDGHFVDALRATYPEVELHVVKTESWEEIMNEREYMLAQR